MGLRARGKTRYQKYAEVDTATGQPHGFPTPTRKVELYSYAFCPRRLRPSAGLPGAGRGALTVVPT